MSQIITFLTNLIISFIGMSGYVGVFLLMAAESALIPIPSEVTMPFAGYLASTGRFNLVFVIIIGALANLAGSILAYFLGAWGQEAVVSKLIRSYGKYFLITESEFSHSEKWFRKYGEKIVFFSRLLPVIRTFISLPAGIAKMNFWRFSMLSLMGSLIWSALLAYIGYALGKNWESIHVYYQKFEILIVGAVLLVLIYYVVHKVKKLKK